MRSKVSPSARNTTTRRQPTSASIAMTTSPGRPWWVWQGGGSTVRGRGQGYYSVRSGCDDRWDHTDCLLGPVFKCTCPFFPGLKPAPSFYCLQHEKRDIFSVHGAGEKKD